MAAQGPEAASDAEPGISDLLKQTLEAGVEAAATRAELATIEFREEVALIGERLKWIVLAVVAAAFGLLAINGLAIGVLWPKLGWGALLLLTVFWAAVAAFGAWRYRKASARTTEPFAATIDTLRRDRQWMFDRIRPPQP
jgi:uncharacterized membrane protein YqjE